MLPKELKNPMTPGGFEKIATEHNHLLNEVRPRVVQGVADAAAEGDRSENAEYIYGKKRLREIDKRLRYLTSLLNEVQIIDPETVGGDRVNFGATVVVEDQDGTTKRWTIVGVGEADLAEGSISWKSPVAIGLMGKPVGSTVSFEIPAGEVEYTLIGLMFGSRVVGGS